MNSEISQIKYPVDLPARNFYHRRLFDPLIAIGLLYMSLVHVVRQCVYRQSRDAVDPCVLHQLHRVRLGRSVATGAAGEFPEAGASITVAWLIVAALAAVLRLCGRAVEFVCISA
jgi:hypothetical protein